MLRQILCSVAHTQQREVPFDGREIDLRGFFIANGEGTSREDHAPYRFVQGEFVERMDLAIDIQLPNPTGDQLGILRSEIQNQDFFLHIFNMCVWYIVLIIHVIVLLSVFRKPATGYASSGRLPDR